MAWFFGASPERPNLFGREPYLATNLAGLTGPHRLSSPMLGLDLSAARLVKSDPYDAHLSSSLLAT